MHNFSADHNQFQVTRKPKKKWKQNIENIENEQ